MAYEYLGTEKGPVRLLYVTSTRFKGCESVKNPGRGRRPSLVLKIEGTTKKTIQNLSFPQRDAAAIVKAVALTLRDAGYRGPEFSFPEPQLPSRSPQQGAARRRRRRRRALTLESLITPGLAVKQAGATKVLEDPKEVEPEVAKFIRDNVERIFRPLREAAVPAHLLCAAADEVHSMTAILVLALHALYAEHAGE